MYHGRGKRWAGNLFNCTCITVCSFSSSVHDRPLSITTNYGRSTFHCVYGRSTFHCQKRFQSWIASQTTSLPSRLVYGYITINATPLWNSSITVPTNWRPFACPLHYSEMRFTFHAACLMDASRVRWTLLLPFVQFVRSYCSGFVQLPHSCRHRCLKRQARREQRPLAKHWVEVGVGWIGDGDWVTFQQLLESRVQIWQEGHVQNLEDQGSRSIHKCLVYTDINVSTILIKTTKSSYISTAGCTGWWIIVLVRYNWMPNYHLPPAEIQNHKLKKKETVGSNPGLLRFCVTECW